MSSDFKVILPRELSNSNYNDGEYFTAIGGVTKHEPNDFGLLDEGGMMTELKAPCHEKSSQLGTDGQMHNVHALLNSYSNGSQKRKLHEYINRGKFATTFDLIGKEKYHKVHRRGHASSLLCSQLSKENKICLQRPQEHVAFTYANDIVKSSILCSPSPLSKEKRVHGPQELVAFPTPNIAEYCRFCEEDYGDLSSSHDSIKEPSPMKISRVKSHLEDSMDNSRTTIKEKPNIGLLKGLKLVNENFANSKMSPLLSSKEEEVELVHPHKSFLSIRGNHLPRPIIPIGPRFQAEVPKWEVKTNLKHHNSFDELKWLGSQIWPNPHASKINTQGIRKGVSDTCSCDFPKSVDCVKKHVSEARNFLKLEIGTAFSSWKFDDMGEEVSKSWTLEEQIEFELLIKLNPLSKETSFWELAMEHFPSKSKKCMLSYYYNVYIPRRMSMETRSSIGVIDCEPK